MDNDDIEEVLNDDNEVTPEKAEQAGTKKVVPAYMKKEENKTEEPKGKNKKVKSKKEKNKTSKSNKKLIIFCVTAVVILVALAIFIYVLLLNKKYEKYKPYEEPMHTYAFDIMYDNGTATTKEKVTKSEAIKMAIAATLNVTSLDFTMIEPDEKYFNNVWIKYAVASGVVNEYEFTEDNIDDSVTFIDMVSYLEQAKRAFLSEGLKTSVELQFKDKDKYTIQQQTYLQDLIETGVIENTNKKLKGNRKLCKGEVNELIVKFAEKNNTITLEGDKININPDKVPSNASEYPYILSNVDKDIYEKDFIVSDSNSEGVKSPKEIYIKRKEYYSAVKSKVEDYYNLILNIDYQTIDAQKLYEEINKFTAYEVELDTIQEYVNYVKDNNIKISGSAKVQMPIIYYDGVYYRIRTKLSVNVENSFVHDNLILGDLTLEETYEYKDENAIVVDTTLTPEVFSNGWNIYFSPISSNKR